MAPFPGKRKRVEIAEHADTRKAVRAGSVTNKAQPPNVKKSQAASTDHHAAVPNTVKATSSEHVTIQIVTGDYERVTHGLAASIPSALLFGNQDSTSKTTFTETFLFTAHTASVRCLAISPQAENDKRFLATGSADERINLYSLSTVPPAISAAAPTLNGSTIAESVDNRSLGSLMHHDRAITRLEFPTKGKLFSAAEDNTVAISRTRDWTMLSSIKAPIPKVQGRPSGDTAAPGEVPTGVNDFAIHPSQKLMLSVCRGEKCMRLWNLMTGKKAGVLNFDRELLKQVGEGKHSSGEGRRVIWDHAGESYVVGFERGAALFGIDSKPRGLLKAMHLTKLHQYRLLPSSEQDEEADLLAVSTEDGRILIYRLMTEPATNEAELPLLDCIAQLGGRSAGITCRIKDFEVLKMPGKAACWLIVAAGSDGSLWLWSITAQDLEQHTGADQQTQIGRLVASHKTQSRITCVAAFVMDGASRAATKSAAHVTEHIDSD